MCSRQRKRRYFSIPAKLIIKYKGLSLPDSSLTGPFSIGAPGVLESEFRTAGYKDVQERILEAPLRFASTKECVRWRREASGTMLQMLGGLNEDAKERIWIEVEDALSQFESSRGFESPCELLIRSGVK
ncbi:MAG: hypothetical protein ACI9XK_004428 [Granulosicoccus sp.]